MRVSSEKNESLFLLTSKSERFVIKTSDYRRDRTSSWTKNGTVQAKLSPRSWLHLFFQLRTSSRRKLGIYQSSSHANIFATTCRQAQWTRWSLLQVKFLSRKESPDFDKAGGDSGRQNWFAISGQLEEPQLLNERRKTHFSFSNLMKQVLKSPNKSTMMDDSIKNYARHNPEQVDYSPVSQGESENNALRHSNMERHEVLKIEDRVQCHIAKLRRDILYSWKHSSWHEAGRATDQQSIHHVIPWSSQISFGEYSNGSTLWKLWCITKPQESKRLFGFRRKLSDGTIVERHQEEERCQMHMHDQGYSHSW